MNINSVLKKENIINIEPLSRLEINKIAKTVTNKLCDTFPEQNLSKSNLFISLARINMYKADMPYESSSAKFFYKNNSIYFKKNVDIENIDTLSIHECIHFLQSVKDSNDNIIKMGLYNPRSFLDFGLGLNEAAVQTLASLCSNYEPTDVKYYNMEFNTVSPDYYPLECSLLNIVLFFTGSYPLIHSTLFSDDVFKNAFIAKSNLETFYGFQNNLNLILDAENDLAILTYKLHTTEETNFKKIGRINDKIEKVKNKIIDLTNATQNMVIKNCFTQELNYVKTLEDAKALQERLYDFKAYVIQNEYNDFYNKFYCDIMSELDVKRSQINAKVIGEVENLNQALIAIDNKSLNVKKLETLILKLKLLFRLKITDEKLSHVSEL